MSFIDRVTTFLTNKTVPSVELNQEFDQILALLNGGLENNNVKQNAGIRQDEGKLVLDYDEIRTQLYTGASDWLDGAALQDGTVDLEKMTDPADDTLSASGIYTPAVWGSFPITVPANQFSHYVLVRWGCTVTAGTHGSGSNVDSEIEITLGGTGVTRSIMSGDTGGVQLGTDQSGAGFAVDIPCAYAAIFNVSSAIDPLSNPPTVDRASPFTLDINLLSSGTAGETLTRKWMIIEGR